MTKILRLLAAGVLPLALLAACGGDDDDDDTAATQAAEDEETDETDETEAATDETEAETEDTEAGEPDETSAEVPDSGSGGCDVKVTGEVETEWHGPDDSGAVLYGPWVPASAATVLDMDFDATDLIINCISGDQSISFTGNGTTEIPMQPATYTILGDQGALGSSDSTINALINLGGEDLYGMAEDGTFEITEFTDERLVGTFTLPVKKLFSGDDSATATATITGTFNLSNHN